MKQIPTSEQLYRHSGVVTDLWWTVKLAADEADHNWHKKTCSRHQACLETCRDGHVCGL